MRALGRSSESLCGVFSQRCDHRNVLGTHFTQWNSLSQDGYWRGDMIARLFADAVKPEVADGEVVTQWVDTVDEMPAIANGEPTLVHDRFSGRAAMRFDASNGIDLFRIDKAANPLVDAEDFSVAVAFATIGPARGNGMPWFAGSGLVDANTLGLGQDWGVTLTEDGQASAGLGSGGAVTTSIQTQQQSLDDGQLHSLVMTRQGGFARIVCR